MTEIAIIDWFGRWGTSVFFENTAIFIYCYSPANFVCDGVYCFHVVRVSVRDTFFFFLIT